MLPALFTQGWLVNVVLYGLVYLLAEHLVYRIIFRQLVGAPKSYQYKDWIYWQRKASFLGAVIFAPLFEEWMFTYLAYDSFLRYAVPGQEGWVILFVGIFFAVLHFPGDFRSVDRRWSRWTVYRLFKGQLDRLFFSLTAYFIYTLTEQLWLTILLHYFINAVVSFFNFDLEDNGWMLEPQDGRLFLIRGTNMSLAIAAVYFMWTHHSLVGICLLPLALFSVFDYIYWYRRTSHA